MYHRFFFNDTATTEIYTLSLHDALPISERLTRVIYRPSPWRSRFARLASWPDRKSTRLNSSHANISYAVFCLKKKHALLSGLFQQHARDCPIPYYATLLV